MLWRRCLGIVLILWAVTACREVDEGISRKLVIGLVGYGESNQSLDKYADLQDYLSIKLKSIVELEPAYNEIQALEQIGRQNWDLVFASSGIAAIAIDRHQYQPIIPLEGVEQVKSAIVVNRDSDSHQLVDLNGKVIALGQEGSATSYYLPIYNLYGLTLQKVRFSPTPQTSLEWLEQQEIDAAALSLQEFNQYRQNFKPNQFRIMDLDSHTIPMGAILISDLIEPQELAAIHNALIEAPSHIAASARFLPSEKIPKYQYMIDVIKKVKPLTERIKSEPALFYEPKTKSSTK